MELNQAWGGRLTRLPGHLMTAVMKRYEILADKIEEMIREGMLARGDKIPSIRNASSQFGVSPSTVFKAYYQLEARGLIRARERFGYYVSENTDKLLPEPRPSSPAPFPADVKVSELIFSVMETMRDNDNAQLGSAFPAMDLFPLEKLAQSLGRSNRQKQRSNTGANVSSGHPALRTAIARRYMTAGVKVSAEDIIITNGAMEALTIGLQAVTQAGDVVAIESPGFYAALQTIERLGLKALEIPTDPNEGLDLDALAEALQNKNVRACWCMCNFQNPLGATMAEQKKQALVQLLVQYEVPLIEDDVYGELYFGNKYQRPAKTFDKGGLVVHCSSFSKTLAPTYRVGWVIAGRFHEKIRRIKLMTTLATSLPPQLAITDYLEQGNYDRHLRKLRQRLEDNQAKMTAAIAEYFPGECKVTRPQGGYFLWVELPSELDALELCRRASKEGVNLAPGQLFSVHGDYSHCIRLNYGQPVARMLSAIKTVGSIACQLAA